MRHLWSRIIYRTPTPRATVLAFFQSKVLSYKARALNSATQRTDCSSSIKDKMTRTVPTTSLRYADVSISLLLSRRITKRLSTCLPPNRSQLHTPQTNSRASIEANNTMNLTLQKSLNVRKNMAAKRSCSLPWLFRELTRTWKSWKNSQACAPWH